MRRKIIPILSAALVLLVSCSGKSDGTKSLSEGRVNIKSVAAMIDGSKYDYEFGENKILVFPKSEDCLGFAMEVLDDEKLVRLWYEIEADASVTDEEGCLLANVWNTKYQHTKGYWRDGDFVAQHAFPYAGGLDVETLTKNMDVFNSMETDFFSALNNAEALNLDD